MATNKETLKQAGYTYVRFDKSERVHILKNEDGGLEKFVARKGHASWGLIWKNTHLEFVSSDVKN